MFIPFSMAQLQTKPPETALAEGELKGKAEGKRELVRGLIIMRLGAVPPALEDQVAMADAATLDALFGRAAVADHLEEIV